jgi:hypothetical protein
MLFRSGPALGKRRMAGLRPFCGCATPSQRTDTSPLFTENSIRVDEIA